MRASLIDARLLLKFLLTHNENKLIDDMLSALV